MRKPSRWQRLQRQSIVMRVSAVSAIILVLALATGLVLSVHFGQWPAKATNIADCHSPAALARIQGPEQVDTPLEAKVRSVLACLDVPHTSVIRFYDHTALVSKADIEVYFDTGPEPNASTARQVIFDDVFFIERTLWQSDIRSELSGVGVHVDAPFYSADCGLSASTAAKVDWASETPEHAWYHVYASTNLIRD